jgi:hypothetical protein
MPRSESLRARCGQDLAQWLLPSEAQRWREPGDSLKQFVSICRAVRKEHYCCCCPRIACFGYAIEVDGRMKTTFATCDGARAGAVELKKRFPLLCIRIYDAGANVREEIQLPQV